MSRPNWTSAKTYSYLTTLRFHELAWEFLRRNEDYRIAFQSAEKLTKSEADSVARSWGLQRLADPNYHARETCVFWLHNECAQVILLEAQESTHRDIAIECDDILEAQDRLETKEGAHILFGYHDAKHQIFFKGARRANQNLRAILPLDCHMPERCKATLSFWRELHQKKPPPKPHLSQRHKRLILILRALDGHFSGASHRLIAETLYPSAQYEEELWKTSYLRATVRRLLDAGYAMMRHEYRELLNV